MLYSLFTYLENALELPGAGLFSFITFRALAGIILSLLISIFIGEKIIRKLQKKQVGEEIRDLDLAGQMQKKGTPTMGGIIIILAIVLPCLLLCKLSNVYIQLILLTTIWMGIIGFIDDYIKVFKKDKEGLKGKFKILGQVILGFVVAMVMLFHEDVVVRMSPDEAAAGGYEVVNTVQVPDRTNPELLSPMSYVKTTLTTVPFIKYLGLCRFPTIFR